MKRKNLYTLIICLATFSFVACDQVAEPEVFRSDFVSFVNSDNLNTSETAKEVIIPIEISQGAKSDVEVSLSIGGTAEKGKDYNLPMGEKITMPSGTYIFNYKVELIDDNEFRGKRDLVLEIANISSNIKIGLAEEGSYKKVITITDDDCPFNLDDFVGKYSVKENNKPVSYDVSISKADGKLYVENLWNVGAKNTLLLDNKDPESPKSALVNGEDFFVHSRHGQVKIYNSAKYGKNSTFSVCEKTVDLYFVACINDGAACFTGGIDRIHQLIQLKKK